MMVVKQLLDHCSRSFGCEGELYQSEEADVLIAVFAPARQRGWWTYVTLELHRTGMAECVLYSYQFDRELITLLARVAAQVISRWEQHRVRIRSGDVFALGTPIAETSCLEYVLATPVDFEEDSFDYFTNGNDVIRMMMLHAIAESEAVFAARYGLDALEDVLARAGVNSLDVTRPPAI